MTALLPAILVEAVDRLDGTRVHDAVLRVRHITRLTCGCHRYSCDRPGGGQVDVIRGQHCEQQSPSPLARPSPSAVPVRIPA